MAFDFAPQPLIDLTDVDIVKAMIGCSTPANMRGDSALQLTITSVSLEWLKLTGHAIDGDVPTASPFVQPVTYDEYYDGPGADILILRTWPIRSVTTLEIDGQAVNPATDFSSTGYIIDPTKRYLTSRNNSQGNNWLASRRYGSQRSLFTPGNQNIHVVSVRGFTSVPADVTRAVTEMVVMSLNRSPIAGITSQSAATPGRSGSMSFDWRLPKQITDVIDSYTCRAVNY